MKSFLATVFFLSLSSAFAASVTKIEAGDLSISEADAKIITLKDYCPKVPGQMSCKIFGSVATVEISLGGCVDRLGGYSCQFEVINGKGYLFFAATSIFNKKSKVVRCVNPNKERVQISIPFEGPVELVNLSYTGSTQPIP